MVNEEQVGVGFEDEEDRTCVIYGYHLLVLPVSSCPSIWDDCRDALSSQAAAAKHMSLLKKVSEMFTLVRPRYSLSCSLSVDNMYAPSF